MKTLSRRRVLRGMWNGAAIAVSLQPAAAHCIRHTRRSQPACALDTKELITTLREHKAKLPQKELSSAMTKSSL